MNSSLANEESKDCIKYHDYMESLAKMSYDTNLWPWERGMASYLRERIGNYHEVQCVTESPKYRGK